MTSKNNPAAHRDGEAGEVFRQFAWHLAGSLATARATSTTRTVKTGGKGGAKR